MITLWFIGTNSESFQPYTLSELYLRGFAGMLEEKTNTSTFCHKEEEHYAVTSTQKGVFNFSLYKSKSACLG